MADASSTYRVRYGPVGEALRVAEVAQVEHAAEQLVLQLRVADRGDGEVGVARRHVRAQPRRELPDVRRHFHYQHTSVQTCIHLVKYVGRSENWTSRCVQLNFNCRTYCVTKIIKSNVSYFQKKKQPRILPKNVTKMHIKIC